MTNHNRLATSPDSYVSDTEAQLGYLDAIQEMQGRELEESGAADEARMIAGWLPGEGRPVTARLIKGDKGHATEWEPGIRLARTIINENGYESEEQKFISIAKIAGLGRPSKIELQGDFTLDHLNLTLQNIDELENIQKHGVLSRLKGPMDGINVLPKIAKQL